MAKDIKTKRGSDGFYYPYTSPDIVVDNMGESQTTKNNNMKADIQIIKENQINLLEDDISMEGINDTEYPTLNTTNKTIIGSINEVNSQCKDIANNKANKNDLQNVQQQVNNLVLGSVGDGNNAEVVQARGNYQVLNDRFNALQNFENFNIKNRIRKFIINIPNKRVGVQSGSVRIIEDSNSKIIAFKISDLKDYGIFSLTINNIYVDNDTYQYVGFCDDIETYSGLTRTRWLKNNIFPQNDLHTYVLFSLKSSDDIDCTVTSIYGQYNYDENPLIMKILKRSNNLHDKDYKTNLSYSNTDIAVSETRVSYNLIKIPAMSSIYISEGLGSGQRDYVMVDHEFKFLFRANISLNSEGCVEIKNTYNSDVYVYFSCEKGYELPDDFMVTYKKKTMEELKNSYEDYWICNNSKQDNSQEDNPYESELKQGIINNEILNSLSVKTDSSYTNNIFSCNDWSNGITGFDVSKKYKIIVQYQESERFRIRTVKGGGIVKKFIYDEGRSKGQVEIFDLENADDSTTLCFSNSSNKYPFTIKIFIYDVTLLGQDVIDKIDFTSLQDHINYKLLTTLNDCIHGTSLISNSIPNDKIVSINSKKVSYWYENKILSALGDSLTANGSGGKYLSYIQYIFNLNTVYNCGIGGTRVSGTGDTCFWQDSRINALGLDSDVLIIMGGTNDCGKGLIVNDEDFKLSNHDYNNFVGAYNLMLSKIFYKFLKVEGYYSDVDYSNITQVDSVKDDFVILIVTPPQTFGAEKTWEDEFKFCDYVKRIAKMWGIPVYDAFSEMGLNYITYKTDNNGYDNVHFSNYHKKLAEGIIGKLKAIEPI